MASRTSFQLLNLPVPSVAVFQDGVVKLQPTIDGWQRLSLKMRFLEPHPSQFCLNDGPFATLHVSATSTDVWIVEHLLEYSQDSHGALQIRFVRIPRCEIPEILVRVDNLLKEKMDQKSLNRIDDLSFEDSD